MNLVLSNLRYFDKNFNLKVGSIEIENGKISAFDCPTDSNSTDMSFLTALPGFVDIHTHGIFGADACDKKLSSLETLSKCYASHGVTSFCPTTMTLPIDELKEIFKSIEDYKGKECGAYIQGINMEGPFVSPKKCGAQNTDYIKPADIDAFKELFAISKVSLVDLAPETENALEFAKEIAPICVCSVAHTNATYEETKKGFESGFSHVTHLFNAMTPFTHRAPGVVGAVFENDSVSAEIICDGFHLSPATVRLAFKILGDDRCVAISDSLSSTDCEDGEYMLGGQKVFVKNGKAHLGDGTIAGSTTNLFDEFKNLISFGIPLKSALKACTVNPAKTIGAFDVCGDIDIGKNADLIFVDDEMNLKHVIVKGKMMF